MNNIVELSVEELEMVEGAKLTWGEFWDFVKDVGDFIVDIFD